MRPAGITFGPFVFDPSTSVLSREGAPVALGGRGASLLQTLLAANGDVVRKENLIEAAWPGTVVEDRNLTVQIAALRKTLGTQPNGQGWVLTVSRVGYRFAFAIQDSRSPRSSGKPSVVVLPFVNLSSDPEQEYFSDGIVEDLITALSRFKTFSVIARNSAFVYKNRSVDVRQVANDLCIRYVLEGSVRRTRDRVRVSTQLIDAITGGHLWAENFDVQLDDIFDVQDRITESVVGLVEPQISRAEIERARRKHPESVDAYDLYLQALPMIFQSDARESNRVVDLLDRAVALDPTFPQALAFAAWMHEFRNTWGGKAPPGVNDQAMAVTLAERALVYGEHDAIVLATAGLEIHMVKGDRDAGIALIDRALAMNPNSPLVLNFAGIVYDHRNEFEKSTQFYQRALRLSPNAPSNFWSLGGIATNFFNLGRFEEAIEWARRSVSTRSMWEQTYRVLVVAHANLNQLEEARTALGALLELRSDLTIAELQRQSRHIARAEHVASYWIQGMRKAGLPEGQPL